MFQELAIRNTLLELLSGCKMIMGTLLCSQADTSVLIAASYGEPRRSFTHRPQGPCLFSVSRWTCCMTTGKAELVGAGHQLLDQSAFSDTGWSTYDQRTGKGLRRLYHSGSGGRFRRRGCLRAFCSSHADPSFAPRLKRGLP